MRYIAALFMLLASPALADSGTIFNIFGTAIPSPSLAMTMHPDANNNLYMAAVANDPAGVKSVTIIGNGKPLWTCPAPVCVFVWARASMRSGQNTVIVQSVNSAGVQRQAPGYVNKPSL